MTASVNRRTFAKRTTATAAAASLASAGAFHAPAIIARQSKAPVVFWTSFSDRGLEVQQHIVDEFNAQSEDVEVTLEQIPPGEVTDSSKLITAVRGGTGPDVYNLDRFIVPERAANGLLEDLTQLLEDNGADPALGDHLDFAANEATYNGSPYALPFQTDARALYYNKALLTEAGVDLTLFDAANGPMTWDQLREAALAANIDNTRGDTYDQMGYVPYYNQAWHYTYGFSWGVDFFDEETCEVTPNTPEMVDAMQWVYDICAELKPSKTQAFIQASQRPGAPPQESPWIQARLATMVSNGQQVALNENYAPDLDYGITYIPVPEAGMESATWAGGWSMVIPQGAKEPEAAIKFMLFACGEPGQRIFAGENRALPTLKTLLKERDLYSERLILFADELLPTARNRPPLPVGAKYWDELTAAYEKIWLNEEDPQPALDTAKENTMSLLGPFCPIS
jgi:multiple sugar transport system substrate-binding protein